MKVTNVITNIKRWSVILIVLNDDDDDVISHMNLNYLFECQ